MNTFWKIPDISLCLDIKSDHLTIKECPRIPLEQNYPKLQCKLEKLLLPFQLYNKASLPGGLSGDTGYGILFDLLSTLNIN